MSVQKAVDTMTAKRGKHRLLDWLVGLAMKATLSYWKWRMGEDMVLVVAPYKDVYAQHLAIAHGMTAPKVELPN